MEGERERELREWEEVVFWYRSPNERREAIGARTRDEKRRRTRAEWGVDARFIIAADQLPETNRREKGPE